MSCASEIELVNWMFFVAFVMFVFCHVFVYFLYKKLTIYVDACFALDEMTNDRKTLKKKLSRVNKCISLPLSWDIKFSYFANKQVATSIIQFIIIIYKNPS